jgi:GNAT superfamily N-acetyltransferase
MPNTPDPSRRDPARWRTWLRLPTGQTVVLRLLRPDDAPTLGAYFLSLSAATRRVYAPHPFDLPTAERLCAQLDPTSALRFVAIAHDPARPAQPPVPEAPANLGQTSIIAYIIIGLTAGASEIQRYAAAGICLDPATTCSLAPSVADAYQSKGVGSVLMEPILCWLRQLGYRQMVLQGGVRAENARAQRFYGKLGFRRVGDFVTQGQVANHDMMLALV